MHRPCCESEHLDGRKVCGWGNKTDDTQLRSDPLPPVALELPADEGVMGSYKPTAAPP